MDASTAGYLGVSAVTSLGSLVLMYIYKSKCSNFSICFGLISIQRDTETEGENDARQIQNQPQVIV
jgi:hypothetical protein